MQPTDRSRRRFLRSATSSVFGGIVACCRHAFSQTLERPGASDASPVASVRYLGKQFLDNPLGVTGADGATSTLLPSGKSLWVFGDTIEGPFKSVHGLQLGSYRSNTAAIVPRQDVTDGIKRFEFLASDDGKRPTQIVPFAPNEDPHTHRVWAIHGTCVGEQIYLFYHRITLIKDVDVFVNFQLDGMGIARASIESLDFVRLAAPDGTLEFWKRDDPSFGVFIDRTDDFLYVWGCLTTNMYLARVPPNSVADLGSYEYLVEAPTIARPNAPPRWSKNFLPTAPLFDAVPNEMSAAYNRHLGMYVAFHSLHRENKVVMRTAPRIVGPWSAPRIVYRPQRAKDSELIYAVKEHPELAGENGRGMYVTFVNSDTYAPEMIEVTLK